MAAMHPSDRKKQLIVQGALHRAEVLAAKETVDAALRPDALARGLISHAALTATALLSRKTGLPIGLNLQSMLPLLMSGISTISRKTGDKQMRRRVLVAALSTLAAVTAGAAAFMAKRKADASADERDIDS